MLERKMGFFSQCVLCKVHLNNKVVCLNDKFAIWVDVYGNDERFLSMLWKNFAWEMELEKVIHCEIIKYLKNENYVTKLKLSVYV